MLYVAIFLKKSISAYDPPIKQIKKKKEFFKKISLFFFLARGNRAGWIWRALAAILLCVCICYFCPHPWGSKTAKEPWASPKKNIVFQLSEKHTVHTWWELDGSAWVYTMIYTRQWVVQFCPSLGLRLILHSDCVVRVAFCMFIG